MAKTREKCKEKDKHKDDKLSSTDPKKRRMKKINQLPPDDKIKFLLENGHRIKDTVFNKVAMKRGIIDKDSLVIGPEAFMAKNGELKNRTKYKMQFFNHILMSEFNIDMSSEPNKHNKTNGENNNDMDTSNQNNSCSSKDKPKKTEKTKSKSNKSNLLEELSDTINTNTPTNPDSPKKTHKHKKGKTKKDKTKTNSKELDKETEKLLTERLQKIKAVQLSTGNIYLGKFECDYCGREFNSKSSLRRHILMHLNIKPFKCRYCHLKFGQCCNWRAHMKKAHPDLKREKYVCRKCRKVFLFKHNLTKHLAAHIKKENPHECVFCDKAFPDHDALSQHEKEHMFPSRYKCSMCSVRYDSKSRFCLHLKTNHSELKDLRCQYCDKNFLRPSSIKRHIQICHGGIRVQCPICKKKLKGHLTEHMRTHENDRPHQCQECGQRFTQSTQLNVHKRSHTGARPYPCRICKRPFSHSNALMLHIRRHTGEKPFQCAMCHMSFSQLPHMKSHMRKIHGKEKFYKCEKCNLFFRLKAERETHEIKCINNKALTFDEELQASMESGESEKDISKLRFLLALLFTKIATKEKLKYLGFNKRLIDDILVESVDAMGHTPCTDELQSPFMRLKTNIAILMQGSVPKQDLIKFRESKKTTEEILELLTCDKK